MAVLQHDGGIGFVAVIEDAVEVNVRERIEMRVRDAVRDDADAVGAYGDHAVLERIGVVDRFLHVGVARERDGEPFPYESSSLPPLRGRDQVERAQLVVLAPAPPVRQLCFPAFELRASD